MVADFANKVVIVTGGALGMGRGACLAFAKQQAKVVVADINAKAADSLIEQIREAGEEAHAVITDVSRAEGARQVVQETVKAFGGVDILFNNVGIQPNSSYLDAETLPEEDWDRILAVNLKSCFLMAKYCIPEMKRRGGGVIINNASVQGLQSQKQVPAYAASKGGVLSLTRNLALDYAEHHIRVLAVCPGSIDTPMLRDSAAFFAPNDPESAVQEWGRRHPLGRIGTPEDVANVVLFLASEKASFLTGEYVCVDGGLMAKGAWE
jgi:NAD(P)-dependent dehydrogenase (short-subunit alcohol dehydrogenase family)